MGRLRVLCRAFALVLGLKLYLVTAGFGLRLVRPDRKDETPRHGSIGWIRQWIESVNDILKGQLDLERHGGRTTEGLYARITQRLLAMAAAIWHNWATGARSCSRSAQPPVRPRPAEIQYRSSRTGWAYSDPNSRPRPMAGVRLRRDHGRMTTLGVRAPATPASQVKRGTRLLALLLPLLAADTYTVFPENGSWLLVIATAAAAVAMPRLTARLVPFALFAYGAYGIWLTHQMISYEGPFTRFPSGGAPDGIIWVTRNVIYGVVRMGSYDNMAYSLPQAVIFLAAGVFLLAVTGAPGGSIVRRAAQQLRGAGAQPKTVPPLLILPVLLLCEELFSNRLWFGTAVNANIAGRVVAILIVAGGVILAVRLPRQAATAAVAGTVLLGITGVLLGLRWMIAYAGFPWHTTVLYGAVPLHTQYSGLFAITQGVALLGAGATLAPRLVTWSGDLELARRAQLLTQRVSRLTQTRSDATEVAVAELRRIERDLHDGAQARLVAVGMSLRAAEELMRSSPEAALALVTEARKTSSRALDDLRDLVRGIYPPVLADRGLAEAVRALALDTPLTVDTDISLPGEPPMPVAAAVYFGIAEVLTNAVRHSGADTVQIGIDHAGGLLRATITDDGTGGADASQGTGLVGVERRLATFDGILAVSSPPGGPTIVVIEVPCTLLADGAGHSGRPSRQPAA